MIKNITKELLVQIWEEELFEDLFTENEELMLPFRHCVKHGMLKDKYEEMGGRFITIVSDKKEVVFGQILSENVAEVIWTESRPMISMASECVRHDMYFYNSASIFKDEMQKELGSDYSKIRGIF